MSTAHNVPSYRHFDAVALSSTNTVYSGATNPVEGGGNAIGSDIKFTTYVSFVGKFTSTPNGTLTLEVSNASDDDILRGVDTWITYTPLNGSGFTNGVATVTSGQINSAATFGVKVRPDFRRIRWKYVNGSGSGTLTITSTIKGSN